MKKRKYETRGKIEKRLAAEEPLRFSERKTRRAFDRIDWDRDDPLGSGHNEFGVSPHHGDWCGGLAMAQWLKDEFFLSTKWD